ncbi:hypothetical protein PHISCL_08794 [Aspergillus sclerotialis]|uniref:DUF1993 domain-containing protein n=1 Tax=Aspergillus sclerotialis TaxID=2070753 RepID=A0A3A2Z6Z9_9EURO|nr:hypothetical protein PHISCL_08794 [Aspergillus sclerotialis]
MPHRTYDGTVSVVGAILTTLSHILHQATQHPKADTLLNARLHEDMYPLADQIRLATQFSENLVARLTGREAVTFDGNPATYAECFERIETVLKAVREADKDIVNQYGDKVELTKRGPLEPVEMSGATFAHTMVLPNIYFHLTTAYGILRKEGVPLGKKDYYVGFFPIQ